MYSLYTHLYVYVCVHLCVCGDVYIASHLVGKREKALICIFIYVCIHLSMGEHVYIVFRLFRKREKACTRISRCTCVCISLGGGTHTFAFTYLGKERRPLSNSRRFKHASLSPRCRTAPLIAIVWYSPVYRPCSSTCPTLI